MLQSIVREKLVAVLDIGTSKICCLIARAGAKGNVQIIGQGISRSKGFKSGKITELNKLIETIRSAVDLAEHNLNESIKKVTVNVSSPSLQSQLIGAEVQLSPYPIGNSDVEKVLNRAFAQFLNENEQILHRIPLSYSIDGDDDKDDPRGMVGSMLGAELNMISSNMTPVRNICNAVESSYMQVESMVATPLASALASLTDDERELGAIMLDIGAGTTSIAVVEKGKVEYVSTIPLGGAHITSDIAQLLAIGLDRAEELKTLYGRTFASPTDDKEMINVIPVGESGDSGTVPIPKSDLIAIIQPRVLEIFEKVKERLIEDNFYGIPSRRVVLTGGTSQLQGMKEAAAFVLDDRQPRIGYPIMEGLPDNLENPGFTTAVGLLKYAFDTAKFEQEADVGLLRKTEKFRRIGKWFLQSF